MKYRLLRFSLLSMLVMLCGGFVHATDPVTAKWDFQNGVPTSITETNIQGTDATGTVASNVEGIDLNVLAAVAGTNIKLQYNSQGYAQFNQNTCIQVPVKSNKDIVTVVSYPGQSKYTVGGENATGQNTFNHTATEAEVQQGYIEIIATATAYLYSIQVVQNEPEEENPQPAQDITANWDFQNLVPATMADVNIQGTNEADVVSDVNGIVMHVISNGGKLQYNASGYAQFNANTTVQIPVKNEGDVVTVVSFPGQSNYTVGGQDATGQNTFEYTANTSDAKKGYVEVVPTKTAYVYSFKVVQKASTEKEPTTLDNEPAVATFSFNLGTEGQKATFSNADYFLNSKVVCGSKLVILDKSNKAGFDQTRFQPTEKLSNASTDNLIQFIITPKPGFSFTPTKVSLKATRYGTNDGKLDFAWINPDKTTISLATGQTPLRENGKDKDNNSTEKFSEYSYDITGATVGEGACGLAINLYGLANNKQIGFADIVIEGTLSGIEKELPILASFTLNGTEYQVEDVFGEVYEATFELSKKDQMVGTENPLTNITATNGEVGTVTYDGSDTQCVVTIPVSAGTTTLDYILNVDQKPDFTLTYLNTDGTELGTQTVEKDATIGEFAIDFTTATARDGYKVRGWFERATGGRKYTIEDVITSNQKLYAVATEIEVASDSKKYEFNLADPNFYAEDHEAFNPAGDGYYFHDTTHGWAFKNGNTVDLLVGPKASVFVTVCLYGSGTGIVVKKGDEILETLAGKSDADGGVVAYNYEGEAGTITLEMQCSGEIYIHSIKIANTTNTNYDKDGQWYFVKAGDTSSFLDVLDAANGSNGAANAERVYIFLPNGTYDLGEKCLTPISGNNISIIGESQDGVVIKNLPPAEGIDITATLKNSGTGNYYQDMTIKND
jgi:hypothetical protein